MTLDLPRAVAAAQQPSPWDAGNEVLYEMCRRRPLHSDIPSVVAKVWLIGRAYAAAIERRRNGSGDNDSFYTEVVAPTIIASGIDDWIEKARRLDHPTAEGLLTILEAHWRVTNLFRQISGHDNRSLASKYLHFHVPTVFYIYDSRAVQALRTMSPLIGSVSSVEADPADAEYRRLSERCLALQTIVEHTEGRLLTPRELDNLLLYGHAGA